MITRIWIDITPSAIESAIEPALADVANPDWWRTFSHRRVQYAADFVRFWMATKDPAMIYADQDVWVRSVPDLPLGLPYFGQIYPGHKGIGNHLFAVNGRCDWFRAFLEECPTVCPPERFNMPLYLMRRRDVGVICADHFYHGRWDAKKP